MRLLHLLEAVQTPRVLFHGTIVDSVDSIRQEGFISPKSWWSPSEDMARYFADLKEGGQVVVLSSLFEAFDQTAFQPDEAMAQDPVPLLFDYHGIEETASPYEKENAIRAMWARSNQDWQASLAILLSVVYTKPVSVEALR